VTLTFSKNTVKGCEPFDRSPQFLPLSSSTVLASIQDDTLTTSGAEMIPPRAAMKTLAQCRRPSRRTPAVIP
jgi:hypothetical protein